MKNINLTRSELDVFETALIRYGNIITFDQLANLFDKDRAYVRKRVSHLAKQGWLKRIKKSLYLITLNLSSRGFASTSPLVIAHLLVSESYVSFAAALQHYGLYDQLLATVSSVSLKKYRTAKIDNTSYKFVQTSVNNFFGWREVNMDGKLIKIASAEKALLDFLQFHRTITSTDLVLEKLSQSSAAIDLDHLIKLGLKTSLTTSRILGFLLDLANLDSVQLKVGLKNSQGVSKLTADSTLFNNKWRLYYDNYFTQ